MRMYKLSSINSFDNYQGRCTRIISEIEPGLIKMPGLTIRSSWRKRQGNLAACNDKAMTLSRFAPSHIFSASPTLSSSLSETSSPLSLPPLLSSSPAASPRQAQEKTAKKTNPPGRSKNGKRSSYKHIPHCLKPTHLVAKRNARERKRVQEVNSAFLRLRKHVPYEPRQKRVSKVKTLRFAIEYIQRLQDLIRSHDQEMSDHTQTKDLIPSYVIHRHNFRNVLDDGSSITAHLPSDNYSLFSNVLPDCQTQTDFDSTPDYTTSSHDQTPCTSFNIQPVWQEERPCSWHDENLSSGHQSPAVETYHQTKHSHESSSEHPITYPYCPIVSPCSASPDVGQELMLSSDPSQNETIYETCSYSDSCHGTFQIHDYNVSAYYSFFQPTTDATTSVPLVPTSSWKVFRNLHTTEQVDSLKCLPSTSDGLSVSINQHFHPFPDKTGQEFSSFFVDADGINDLDQIPLRQTTDTQQRPQNLCVYSRRKHCPRE